MADTKQQLQLLPLAGTPQVKGKIVRMWIKLTESEIHAQQALLERELTETSANEEEREQRAKAIKSAPATFRRR